MPAVPLALAVGGGAGGGGGGARAAERVTYVLLEYELNAQGR